MHGQVLRTAGAGKEIYLCGHSLGGALAAALALCMATRCDVAGSPHQYACCTCMPASSACPIKGTILGATNMLDIDGTLFKSTDMVHQHITVTCNRNSA